MLHSSPSLSIFNANQNDPESEGKDTGTQVREEENQDMLVRTVTIGDSIGATELGSGEFSFGRESSAMGLIEEELEKGLLAMERLSVADEEWVGDKEPASPPMYLAAGLGIRGNTGDGILSGVEMSLPEFDGVGDEEEYYKKMVDEYPCHPVFLAKYAKLLESKGDLCGADEFYHRATLADPENGKILLQHAKLVWKVHRDQHRALQIFRRAAQVAPDDSQILGAYASFLWEIDYDDDGIEEDISEQEQSQAASVEPEDGNVEEHYKRMLGEDPFNSSVLKTYARFLVQNKQDYQRAEEYYERAAVVDPKDGEIMSEYANIVWELHHDHEKTSHFHKKAAEAAPQNSYILASYASFLWETENNEVDAANPDHSRVV